MLYKISFHSLTDSTDSLYLSQAGELSEPAGVRCVAPQVPGGDGPGTSLLRHRGETQGGGDQHRQPHHGLTSGVERRSRTLFYNNVFYYSYYIGIPVSNISC